MKRLLFSGSSYRFKNAIIYLVYFNPEAEDPQGYFVERSVANMVPHCLLARAIFLSYNNDLFT
ncbi:MAG: hypothetical protein JWR61_2759 [Ferruginibacter sp.]|nr:hypothetical protein [Ferruginibacter sp.]